MDRKPPEPTRLRLNGGMPEDEPSEEMPGIEEEQTSAGVTGEREVGIPVPPEIEQMAEEILARVDGFFDGSKVKVRIDKFGVEIIVPRGWNRGNIDSPREQILREAEFNLVGLKIPENRKFTGNY